MGIKEFEVGGEKLVIHELDDVCDSVTGRALTGSWTWDSALVLSHWMLTQGRLEFDFAGKTVLELGAGTGLPGLTAALLGASRVILTDVEPLLPQLRKNVEANGLGDRVEVSRLVWGSEEDVEELGAVVDLVLMSDVLFDAAEVAALGRTLRRVCGGEGTKVWAANEVRLWSGECKNVLVSEGFEVVELPSQFSGNLDEFAVFHLVNSSNTTRRPLPPPPPESSSSLSLQNSGRCECQCPDDFIQTHNNAPPKTRDTEKGKSIL